MYELVNGIQNDESVQYFQDLIARMKLCGCNAVVLGCTGVPIIITDSNSPLPTLDSTRLLAHAALHHAINPRHERHEGAP
ncbi:hypothetical protein CWS35_27520 [Bradyrhizobium sp. SK17]|jgi:aspartate racemase|nr:hypothetical protein CWS35_27520 [Bradyrhizobium sp. SK17]MBN8949832.1 aspartate/glutamate racemase family protein [Rhizobium tropici]OJY62780.1 MAG: hypothetical protein BGP09_17035 [Rhizobium sp. 60-20]